jgi:hypothetical protein
MRGKSPARWLNIDMQTNQMRSAPTNHVGTDTGGRQLDQMGKRRQLAYDDPRRFVGVDPW